MKLISKASLAVLIGLTFMQAGASLFAIIVNISSLISAPPASLITRQGEYAFNPDLFWEKFPSLVMISLLVALVFNWRYSMRKWIIAGGLIWVLSGLVVFTLLSPAQSAFLSIEYSNTIDPSLFELGLRWRNTSLLFMGLSALSGFVYLFGLLFAKKNRSALL